MYLCKKVDDVSIEVAIKIIKIEEEEAKKVITKLEFIKSIPEHENNGSRSNTTE